jgi:hypothetical protein
VKVISKVSVIKKEAGYVNPPLLQTLTMKIYSLVFTAFLRVE